MLKNMEKLKKRKLRNLIKYNVLWGPFSLNADSVFHRLVD
jgi:hypothetical protein